MADARPYVIDADDASFQRLALEASHERPVVVDFWAPWCGPCRQLGPLLQRLADEFAGAFLLVQVDTERAPRTAQAWNIRSIPAVVGLRDGEVVADFVGAQPESAVREFLRQVIPSPADERTHAAMVAAQAGQADAAESAFREALVFEAGHPAASMGLGHLLLTRGDLDGAEAVASGVSEGSPLDAEIERLRAAIRMQRAGGADLDALKAAVDATPEDVSARIDYARALAADRQYAPAVDVLIDAIRLDPERDEQAARRALLELFEVLGSDHDLTREARTRLARLLYR